MGVTFSFLITSPLINEYLVVLMLGFFGFKITILYVISGVAIGVTAGIILGKLNLEKYISKDLIKPQTKLSENLKFNTLKLRIFFGFHEASYILKKLWAWIILGVGIGAMIHNFVPQELVQSIIKKQAFYQFPLLLF